MAGPEIIGGDIASVMKEVRRRIDHTKIRRYQPYPYQVIFHGAGYDNPERMLMAANRVGKTFCAACEVSFHMTGRYPDWWAGKRFDRPVLVWTGSPTNESSRDIVQKELLGGAGETLGQGAIPRDLIEGEPMLRQAGVKNVYESVSVKHLSGGISQCVFKAYEQGWKKWQGTAPHVVWLDEEPDDYMIFSEATTRILTSNGIIMVTFTPLMGETELVQHFRKGGPGISLTTATWMDAPHLDVAARERLRASYRAHEVDARTKGIPMLGEGAVFPVPEEFIRVDPIKIPDHWLRIKGCDFGIDHPAAGVELAIDTEADVIYVIDCYKASGQTAAYHAAWFNKVNAWVPVAWPHDGVNRERTGGREIRRAYLEHNVAMLNQPAHYKPPAGKKPVLGAQPVEPMVQEILERMLTSRFKVFSNLQAWFQEFRSFHRKDGRIIHVNDDILKATFYAVMMRRRAVSKQMVSASQVAQVQQMPVVSASY